jgi:tol-pal system protein YbgF
MRYTFVLAFAALLVAGPGVAPAAANREHQQIVADIRMLQEQTSQLQLLISSVTEALTAVTARLDEQVSINRKAFADQKLLIDGVAGDVRVLRETLAETNVRISSLSHEMEALRLMVPQPTTRFPRIDPQTGEVDPEAQDAGPPILAPGMTPQRMFDEAWTDYAAGQWALAIQGFETYIRTFPRSELADDAQLYIGEVYYAEGKFRDAVAAYDLVIQNYADGNRVPDAYYKRGLALDRLEQTDRARESFQYVVNNYPDSDAARLAKQALDRLSLR